MPRKKLKRDPTAKVRPFSKNLLSLKFMQRRRVGTEPEDKLDNIGKQKCIENSSYFFCAGLRNGRFSFKGQNLEIEAMAEVATVQKKRPAETIGNDEDDADEQDDNEIDNNNKEEEDEEED